MRQPASFILTDVIYGHARKTLLDKGRHLGMLPSRMAKKSSDVSLFARRGRQRWPNSEVVDVVLRRNVKMDAEWWPLHIGSPLAIRSRQPPSGNI